MKKLQRIFAVLVLGTLTAFQAGAWNMAGHMLTGAFVYQELSRNNPQLLEQVLAILREHPEYDTRWAAPLSRARTAEEEAQILLMLAARWPDDARDDEEQHRANWHYISFPYGQGPTPSISSATSQQPSNLVQAFRLAADKVSGRVKVDAGERAIALCWLLHLGGDAHQPLHAVSMFNSRFPKGDKGGNMQYIRPDVDAPPKNLHSLWDGLVIGTERFNRVQNEATRLRNAYPASSLQNVQALDPVIWTRDESFPLAKRYGYLNGKLRTATVEDRAPALPDGYLNDAKQVAEERISLAGYRLVGVLGQLLPSP